MTDPTKPLYLKRKPLYLAMVSGVFALGVTAAQTTYAGSGKSCNYNKTTASADLIQLAATCNPCNPCNPCGGCNPCNPCAAD